VLAVNVPSDWGDYENCEVPQHSMLGLLLWFQHTLTEWRLPYLVSSIVWSAIDLKVSPLTKGDWLTRF
jgi:hypothetical protein